MKIHYPLLVAVVGIAWSSGLYAQSLYGWGVIRTGAGTGHIGIYAVNPDNAETVLVADTGVSSYGVQNATFDPIRKRYFLDGSSDILMINLVTGVTTIRYADGLSLCQADPVTGLLYCMKNVFPSGHLFVFSLNPDTGETALVADTGVTSRSSAPVFDPFTRRYVFVIYDFAEDVDKLLVLDLDTGTITRVPSVLGGLVFDPVTRLFYGIRFMPASGTIGIFSLDVMSGATTFVADTGLTNTSGFLLYQSLDPIGRRYFLTVDSFATRIVVVNLVRGDVSELNVALLHHKFDSGSFAFSAPTVPTLNLSFLSILMILIAFVGLWRTAT